MKQVNPNQIINKRYLSSTLPDELKKRFIDADVYIVDASSFQIALEQLLKTYSIIETLQIDNLPENDLVLLAVDDKTSRVLFCGFYFDCHKESGKGNCMPILPPEMLLKAKEDSELRNDLHKQLMINKAVLITLLSMKKGVTIKKNSNNKLGIGTGSLTNGRCSFTTISADAIPIIDQSGKVMVLKGFPHLREAELHQTEGSQTAKFYRPMFVVEALAYLPIDQFNKKCSMIRAVENVVIPSAKPSISTDLPVVHTEQR